MLTPHLSCPLLHDTEPPVLLRPPVPAWVPPLAPMAVSPPVLMAALPPMLPELPPLAVLLALEFEAELPPEGAPADAPLGFPLQALMHESHVTLRSSLFMLMAFMLIRTILNKEPAPEQVVRPEFPGLDTPRIPAWFAAIRLNQGINKSFCPPCISPGMAGAELGMWLWRTT